MGEHCHGDPSLHGNRCCGSASNVQILNTTLYTLDTIFYHFLLELNPSLLPICLLPNPRHLQSHRLELLPHVHRPTRRPMYCTSTYCTYCVLRAARVISPFDSGCLQLRPLSAKAWFPFSSGGDPTPQEVCIKSIFKIQTIRIHLDQRWVMISAWFREFVATDL
jgi:hypothetical protein